MQNYSIISEPDVVGRLRWQEVVEALRKGHLLPKAKITDALLGEPERSFLNRAAWVSGLGGGVKSVTIFSHNPARAQPLPSVQGVFLFFDDETGSLKAVIDGPMITKWKTAADSVLGAKLLARPDARRAVIIGAGALAASLAEAYAAAMPDLERILVWARNSENANRLATAVDDVRVQPAGRDLGEAVSEADIISTATSSSQPILKGAWVGEGAHVDLVGAFRPEMREADDELMRRGRIFVDSRETTIAHIGELMIPLQNEVIREDDVRGDLYDLVAGATGRTSPRDITVFKNGGGAHLDLMTAAVIYDAATKKQ